MMTGHPGVFAGGDVMSGSHVTSALGHGERAARQIDAGRRDESYEAPARPALATADGLDSWYYAGHPTVRSRLQTARRLSTFDLIRTILMPLTPIAAGMASLA